ncbi:phage major capsid protein [Corynebacterium flavescens]|uniref:phage major capsid protein n=1 Tax=Corynebacterium flavescens TaxID=28028 RepID=UPI003FD42C3D
MSTNTTTANALIQEQIASFLVEPLESESVVLAAKPKILNSSEPLLIPRLDSVGAPEWVGENELIPESDIAFSEMKLMPTERKSIKVMHRVSNESIRLAKKGVTTILQQALVKRVSNTLDDALLKGTGEDATVTGILNQAGVQKGTLDVAAPDSLLEIIAKAEAEEVTPNHWFMSAADYLSLSKLKDGNERYLLQNSKAIDGAMVKTLFNIPVTVTNKLKAGEGALVDMNEVAVVRDVDPVITVNDARYLEFDQVAIRVVTRYDLGLLHPKGVVVFGAGA